MRPAFPLFPFLLTATLAACHTAAPDRAVSPPPSLQSWELSPDLQVTLLRPGVWLHTSWRVLADGTRFPSNGLIVREGEGLLLVDSAWGEPLTEQLLTWIEDELRRPVHWAIATHSHDDRLGGIAVLSRRGVTMVAHPLTRELAAKEGSLLPEALPALAAVGGSARVGPAEVFYAGPGHAPDNVMVWLPESRILFGGCAVRAATAEGLGNVADAVLAEWPRSIERLVARYPDVQLVVPGHGAAGGPELLPHTIALLRK